MLDIFALQRIATARLEDRVVADGETVFVQLGGGREARLPRRQWQAILDEYHAAVAPSGRRLRRTLGLSIPFSILLLAIIANVPGLSAAAHRVDRAVPILLPMLLMAGLPLVATVRHLLVVRRGNKRALRRLDAFPNAPAVAHARRSQASPLAKVLVLILIPHILIQSYGSFDPDAYRNTPWTGTKIDWTSIAAFLVLIWLGLRRVRPISSAAADELVLPEQRTNDVVARARSLTAKD